MSGLFRLSKHIIGIEFRKFMTYRVDFWSGFLGIVFAEICVAYFLWSSIFAYRGVSEINGYGFKALMLYYVLLPFIVQITHAQSMHAVSEEIYQGSLTRYIVYPLSFMHYKLLSHLSYAGLAALQLLIALAIFIFCFGVPDGVALTWQSTVLCLCASLLGSVLYFLMASCLEMTAFWADHVWSLNVMLRLSFRLLGGGFVPMHFFPEGAQDILRVTPFYLASAFPIEVAMGTVSMPSFFGGMALSVLWIAVMSGIAHLIWQRGKLQYTGVGI